MIQTEQKEITKTIVEEVPVSGRCDICGKNLFPVNPNVLPPHLKDKTVYDYYRITTHHHDWGNDSVDSYHDIDCCGLSCVLKFTHDYWNGCTNKTPWPTLRLEMKHMWKLEEHENGN